MIDNNSPNDPYYFQIDNAEISIDNAAWLSIDDLESIIAKIVNQEEFSILLTDDHHIQQLNRDFRNIDKPTNVLSFPAEDDDGGEYLGDIAIAYETMKREAIEQEKSFKDHLIHMVLHGLLHLQGYDHETDADAEEMESLEIKILADIGIKNPYI